MLFFQKKKKTHLNGSVKKSVRIICSHWSCCSQGHHFSDTWQTASLENEQADDAVSGVQRAVPVDTDSLNGHRSNF